jgi:hypothetical protein
VQRGEKQQNSKSPTQSFDKHHKQDIERKLKQRQKQAESVRTKTHHDEAAVREQREHGFTAVTHPISHCSPDE